MNDSFLTRSIKERLALKHILPELYKSNNDFDYNYYETPVEGKDIYDAFLIKMFKETGSIMGRAIIEIKIRDKDWGDEGLMLESIKLNALLDKARQLDGGGYKCNVAYISVTPTNTYAFNLTSLKDGLKWETRDCPVSTVDPSRGRINKKVTFLKSEDGRIINYNKTQVDNEFANKDKKETVVKNNEQHRKNYCLFNDFFKIR